MQIRLFLPNTSDSNPASNKLFLDPSIKAGYPLQIVAMDIMGPFSESTAGNSFILMISDYFTRWVEAFGIPNQAATTVASKITEQFFFRFGLPEQLHSD